nr:Kiwa anti-phage protein KwaB-like domain-containing protein [Lelliottia sp. AC1]
MLDRNIYIMNKKVFERVLSYKIADIDNFNLLIDDPEFCQLLTDAEPLKRYVVYNVMQLRRTSSIKQKGYYKVLEYMANLMANALQFRLNLQFDAQGKIIVIYDCCADVFQALLVHRFQSHFSAQSMM